MERLLNMLNSSCKWLQNMAILYKAICVITIPIVLKYLDIIRVNIIFQYIFLGVLGFLLCFILFSIIAFYKGVFAVSAIIINDNHEVLLVYDEKEGIYKQPGGHYKTNKLAFRKELLTPYNFILKIIENETDLRLEDISIINFYGILGEEKISNFYKGESLLGKYANNIMSLAPIYVLKEISERKKTSGEKFHIDFFYAFKITNEINETHNLKFFKITDMEEKAKVNKIHKDLIKVSEDIIMQYKKMKYPVSNIRFCTFSNKQGKKIYWRITKRCNANCYYCISRSQRTQENHNYTDKELDDIIKKLNDGNYEKIIITGGEPFTIEKLGDILAKVSEQVDCCDEISVCTNALAWNDIYVKKLFDIEKVKKFVVSVDAYTENTYCKSKGIQNTSHSLAHVLKFIKEAYLYGKDVTVNVMISKSLMDKTQEYVDFWRNNDFKDISLSYPVHSGQNYKHKVFDTYNMILKGKYGDMSFCNSFELILSDCDNNNCPNSSNIHSIDITEFHQNCIDNHR